MIEKKKKKSVRKFLDVRQLRFRYQDIKRVLVHQIRWNNYPHIVRFVVFQDMHK